MFRKLLLTTALVACTVLSAQASPGDDTTYFYKGSLWSTFQSTIYDKQRQPTYRACGVEMYGHNEKGQHVAFSFKGFDFGPEARGLYFILIKDGWNFPGHDFDSGVPVELSMGFDDDPHQYLLSRGRGYTRTNAMGKFPTVEYTVTETDEGQTDAWLEKFAHADHMWIKFRTGNERPWIFPMTGTRAAVTAYHRCQAQLPSVKRNPDTVPYNTTPVTRKSDGDI
jgi:hypothetical protein